MKSNHQLTTLIQELNKHSSEQNVKIWKRIAKDLGKSTRQRRLVNIMKLSEHTKENDTVVIPGKVLGNGEISHKLTIAAWTMSESAKEKLQKSGASIVSIPELMKQNPKGNNVRIIG